MNEKGKATVSESEAQAIIDTVKELHGPEVVTIGAEGQKVLVVPAGMQLKELKPLLAPYMDAPDRRRGIARAVDLETFINHTKRFADDDSAIFADPGPEHPRLVTVFDYHRKTAEGAPRFGQHRCAYECPLSDEWRAWTGNDGVKMDQAAFASFIEDHITDLATPDEASEIIVDLSRALDVAIAAPVKVMELSRGLSMRVGSRVLNAINLQSGEAQVNYEIEHQDKHGHPLKVPGAFLLKLPVFRNGALYKLAARLRYRTQGGSISWFYSLYRAERTFEHAFEEACEQAARLTGLPLYVGTPESGP